MPELKEEDVKKIVLETVREYNKSGIFIDRKVTDTPTDSFSPVNRRFVTLSSNIGARPAYSVATVGQRFFDLTNNVPIFFTIGGWRNSVGSVVAG